MNANAADVYQTIDVVGGQYPNIDFYPRALHINQGDTLHLTIRNTRTGYTRIFMPAFNLSQDIPPGNVAQVDLCVSNPIDKSMWFQISSLESDKVRGNIIVNNYCVPVVQLPQRTFNLAALDPLLITAANIAMPKNKNQEEPLRLKQKENR
ncbi:MAG: hypothetical protein MZV64_64905 [Ignavibacteriales bacterium]|nr:hypothetical protein [Ignavibacteriales bacterium]